MGVAATLFAHARSVRDRWRAFVTPAESGLPAPRVLGAGLLLVLLVFAALVVTAVNGTSSGAFFSLIYPGSDPALLAGAPNLIRTDEWNVQTVWAITQVQQGLPALNATFPGGMDATVPQDLPRADWTVAFRPHLWGYLFFDIDHAQAWKWWMPVFGVAGAAYTFALALLPRRPLTSMTLAVAFAASPFFAWWLLQTTLWPVAWGFLVLAAAMWAVRTPSRRSLWVWAVVVGYFTVVMGMGIYVPFILPIALVVAFVVTGIGIEAARLRGWGVVLSRISSLLVGGVVAGIVLVVWLITRWSTVDAFLSTAYPGERLYATGRGSDTAAVAALFGSSFTDSLRHAGRFLNGNASESATFFLPGVFLAVVVVWLTVVQRRAGKARPWALLLGYAGILMMLAFIFIPGWDAVAHVLFLDRTTAGRMRIGLGFASMVVVVLLLARVSARTRPGWIVSAVGAVAYALSQTAIAVWVWKTVPGLLDSTPRWWVYAAIGAVVIFAVARARPAVVAAGLLLIGLTGSIGVNPVYVGVFDLRTTEPSQTIQQLNAARPGAWVGVGESLTTALLLESGVTAFNGFQGAPGEQVWELVDPVGQYEYQWNRLAAVTWVAEPGEPVVTNPAPDVIAVTFDGCSRFAQANVQYVLSDQSQAMDGRCLERTHVFTLNDTELTVWKVVTRG